jgi:hypothetical protein
MTAKFLEFKSKEMRSLSIEQSEAFLMIWLLTNGNAMGSQDCSDGRPKVLSKLIGTGSLTDEDQPDK